MKNIVTAFSSFSVKDIDEAKAFYKDTLGLEVNEDNKMHLLNIILPGTSIMLYPKPDHKPAAFTVCHIVVKDIEIAVDEAIEKGVTFIQYDEPMKTTEKGIYHGQYGETLAWFTDPSGNILAFVQYTTK